MYNFSYPRKKINCCLNINLTLFLQPLDFFNSDPSFSLEGRIIRKVGKKKKRKKWHLLSNYLPCPWFCSRLSKVKVDVSVSIIVDEEPRVYKAMHWPSTTHLVRRVGSSYRRQTPNPTLQCSCPPHLVIASERCLCDSMIWFLWKMTFKAPPDTAMTFLVYCHLRTLP